MAYTLHQELTDATLETGAPISCNKRAALKLARQLAAEKAEIVKAGGYCDIHAFVVCDCAGQAIAAFKTGAEMGR